MSNSSVTTGFGIKAFVARLAALIGLVLLAPAIQADTIEALPGEVNINGVEFVLIPEGSFYKAGGLPGEGMPFELHQSIGEGNVEVWLESFYIAKYEARARDLVSFLNSGSSTVPYELGKKNCSVDRTWYGRYVQKDPKRDLPATHLSWELSDQWAQWMGFRLPSEDEWERAARGSDQRLYPWGDEYPDETYAGFRTSSYCFTWPVDSFLKGVSPYGVYNMAGNVREYVADWYSVDRDKSFKQAESLPPVVVKEQATTRLNQSLQKVRGPWKMLKGGRWAANGDKIRIGARVYWSPDIAFRCNGTRFALDVDTVREHLANGSAEITQL